MFARLLPLLACSGCATMWIASQAGGWQKQWDESVHEVRVPQPGYEEQLAVVLPLAPEYEPTPPAQPNQPPPPLVMKPFALSCKAEQRGHDLVYHQAFRYGSRWKTGVAISVLVEGALGALGLLTATSQKPAGYVYGAYLAADAAIALPLFFIPRKEIYRTDDVAVATPVRDDCPDGLALEIAGDTYPVDAAGRITDVAQAALTEWMNAPTGALRIIIAGQARDLPITDGGRCTWRHNHGGFACQSYVPEAYARTTIVVPQGTLSRAAEAAEH